MSDNISPLLTYDIDEVVAFLKQQRTTGAEMTVRLNNLGISKIVASV